MVSLIVSRMAISHSISQRSTEPCEFLGLKDLRKPTCKGKGREHDSPAMRIRASGWA